MTGSPPGYCDECGSALKMGVCRQCSGLDNERQRTPMNQRDILQLLVSGYALRLNDRAGIEAVTPEVEIEGIPSNPEEENPLSKQDRHRYR